MDDYKDILREWERMTALPAVYEHLDTLLPAFGFRRMLVGSQKDHWASSLKANLTHPKQKNPEKTVVYKSDMKIREQGDWSSAEGVMDRIMRDRGLSSIYEAYSYVSSVIGLDMPSPTSDKVRQSAAKHSRREQLLSYLEDYFCWCLWNTNSARAQEVRSYLEKKRGFDRQAWDKLRFGFVPEWGTVIRRTVTDGGFTIDEINEYCPVPGKDGKSPVGTYNILSIPFRSAGILRGFLFRSIKPSEKGAKYIANTNLNRKAALFASPGGTLSNTIAIVEGELDALQAAAQGIPDVYAIGGSDLGGERSTMIRDAITRGAKKIILCLDLDTIKDTTEANHTARHQHNMRCVQAIKEIDFNFDEIYIALFSRPCDPDEFLRTNGADAFVRLLGEALPYWEYDYAFRKGLIGR